MDLREHSSDYELPDALQHPPSIDITPSPPSHLSALAPAAAAPLGHNHLAVPHTGHDPNRHAFEAASIVLPSVHLGLPDIRLQPATPSSPSDAGRGAVLFSGVRDERMSTPPPPASVPLPPSPRKRLTMGPRKDCEQCRLRVPGHWMHFD